MMYENVFSKKTTTDLFQILNEKEKYTPVALEEVVFILKERGELDENYQLTSEEIPEEAEGLSRAVFGSVRVESKCYFSCSL